MSTQQDVYMIARDRLEASRLATQHAQYIQCQGYYIHPAVFSALPADAKIAELATGTSIWLQELAASNPHFECHGFDIDGGMFPAQDKSRAKLHIQNVKAPFEATWHSFFDAVHIRFLCTVMSVEDWSIVLKHAVQILKPGGWIQWGENDTYLACRFLGRDPPPSSADRFSQSSHSSTTFSPPPRAALQRLVPDIITHEMGEAMTWGILNLERLFADPNIGGLNSVFIDSYSTDAIPSLRRPFTIMCIEAAGSVKRKHSGTDEEVERAAQWQEEAVAEVMAGTYMSLKAVNFIGRKPPSQ